MGEKGKRHVKKNFSFEPFAKKLNEHINELLKRSKTSEQSFSFLLTFVFCLIFSLVIYGLFF
jgi:hypothetical protein